MTIPPEQTRNKLTPTTIRVGGNIIKKPELQASQRLPPAAIVYGVAAGAFFAFSLFLLVGHHWIDGLLTMVPGGLFTAFAVHLVRYSEPRR